MARRTPLRRDLAEAWRATIEGPYGRGEIDSEATLAAHFHTQLAARFQARDVERRILHQQRVVFAPDGARRYPDLLVCNRRSVIAVIELKYAPRAVPTTRKDLDTLARFAVPSAEVEVEQRRFLGAGRARRSFAVARDALLCWAGVYRGAGLDLGVHAAAFGERFLQFDALTTPRRAPIVRAMTVRGRRRARSGGDAVRTRRSSVRTSTR